MEGRQRRRMGTGDQGGCLMQSASNTRVNTVFRRENWIAISKIQDRYCHVLCEDRNNLFTYIKLPFKQHSVR